jgi:curved DNA-binding protein CbpA
MAGKDPYELLGVPRDATDERIRAAYELEVNRATREGAFRYAAELATAYETISNSQRRALYERHGLTAIRERSPGAAPPPRSWRAAPSDPVRSTRRRSGRWKRLVFTLLVVVVIAGLFALSLSSR